MFVVYIILSNGNLYGGDIERGGNVSEVGILTFHYSNNYGGVLQALSLQKAIEEMGFNVEVINYVPSEYKPTIKMSNLGIRKNVFKNNLKDLSIVNIIKKINIMYKHNNRITFKFDKFREREMKLSARVDENSLKEILDNYKIIVVGSDQIWNPTQRKKPEYFLNYKGNFRFIKIAYAADSTTKEVDMQDCEKLKPALEDFSYISVRNKHSFSFVKYITNKEVEIVADPTIIYDFEGDENKKVTNSDYILTYILGKEIQGTHKEVIKRIKNIYGNLPVYAIKIPTMKFELSAHASKVFYELYPGEWINMFRNANFIYTDSFHGTLYALKYNIPFLAYYTEKTRSTRFIDIGERYGIKRYLVKDIEEIDEKDSIKAKPDFKNINRILEIQKHESLKILKMALYNNCK